MELSLVIPVRDEAQNIVPLIREIRAALDGLIDYEVICVDDGSRDATPWMLAATATTFARLRVVRHRKSYGQSAAVLSGVRAATAPWVVTLDGDGQNDPADIPKLLEALNGSTQTGGVQLVAGVRLRRCDSPAKRITSRIANAVRRRVLKDGAVDSACGLKLFSREEFLALPHFDHMHRFLPALMLRNGGRLAWVAVHHRPRVHGRSHYGLWERLWAGVVDMLGVRWLCRRASLPQMIEPIASIEEETCARTFSG